MSAELVSSVHPVLDVPTLEIKSPLPLSGGNPSTAPSIITIENDKSIEGPAVVTQEVRAPPKVYRAHRDLVYEKITEKNVEDYGFKFDSDLYVYNENQTQLTSVILNRSLFVTSDSFKEYECVGDEEKLTDACVKKLNDWLQLWGKIPGFLEVRGVPTKGFGIFTKNRILRGVFIGYYDGIRHPSPNINPKNPCYFTYCNVNGEEIGSVDGQNLTFSNFSVFINDGNPNRYNVGFISHNYQILVVSLRDIEAGEELVGSYGDQYWKIPGRKKFD